MGGGAPRIASAADCRRKCCTCPSTSYAQSPATPSRREPPRRRPAPPAARYLGAWRKVGGAARATRTRRRTARRAASRARPAPADRSRGCRCRRGSRSRAGTRSRWSRWRTLAGPRPAPWRGAAGISPRSAGRRSEARWRCRAYTTGRGPRPEGTAAGKRPSPRRGGAASLPAPVESSLGRGPSKGRSPPR